MVNSLLGLLISLLIMYHHCYLNINVFTSKLYNHLLLLGQLMCEAVR